jgi:hypothetical protein
MRVSIELTAQHVSGCDLRHEIDRVDASESREVEAFDERSAVLTLLRVAVAEDEAGEQEEEADAGVSRSDKTRKRPPQTERTNQVIQRDVQSSEEADRGERKDLWRSRLTGRRSGSSWVQHTLCRQTVAPARSFSACGDSTIPVPRRRPHRPASAPHGSQNRIAASTSATGLKRLRGAA